MFQIGLLLIAASLFFAGIQALRGEEKTWKQTSEGVAVAMLVIAVALAVFALVFLPMMLPF